MEINGLLFFEIWSVVLAVGISLAVLRWERRRKLRRLRTQGRRVIAIVTQVQQEGEQRGPAEFPLTELLLLYPGSVD